MLTNGSSYARTSLTRPTNMNVTNVTNMTTVTDISSIENPKTNAKPTSNALNNAVVLLSGGLDSVTCLYWAKARFAKVTAISFRYGQRHSSELQTAIANAKRAGVDHRIIEIDLAQLGGSSLTDHEMAVPIAEITGDDDLNHANSQPESNQQHIAEQNIPNTYVPARNTIFLSYALAVAEVTQSNHIVIGVSSVDYSGYPDCRPEYINAFAVMANLATKSGVTGHKLSIETPLQQLSKAETILLGLSLGVDYQQTVSCYQADESGRACGQCDSCHLRKQGFAQAGVSDPTRYIDSV